MGQFMDSETAVADEDDLATWQPARQLQRALPRPVRQQLVATAARPIGSLLSSGNLDETVTAIRMRLCGRDGSEIVAARQAMQGQFDVDRRCATDGVSA
jgi:hypothetical protein